MYSKIKGSASVSLPTRKNKDTNKDTKNIQINKLTKRGRVGRGCCLREAAAQRHRHRQRWWCATATVDSASQRGGGRQRAVRRLHRCRRIVGAEEAAEGGRMRARSRRGTYEQTVDVKTNEYRLRS